MKNMKYALLILLLAVLGYNSVYFEKLSERGDKKTEGYDFTAYADSLYSEGILKAETPITLDQLLAEVKSDPNIAYESYGNRLGIGNSAYFMVSLEGTVSDLTEGQLKVRDESGKVWPIDTKFIFGNAIRDASKLVELTDFKTNAEFNALSEALNSVIREKAIPEDLNEVKQGDLLSITGAIKLSKNEDLPIRILPIQISKP
ncbi:DUF2291 family protein [Jiulongibacter sp. NS-SX5]|uniref:DUF2291 family protein n=1 Tax=Jiulongibacter sp. NS-SX5 TaxID=3463854 RepID=UPI0040595119